MDRDFPILEFRENMLERYVEVNGIRINMLDEVYYSTSAISIYRKAMQQLLESYADRIYDRFIKVQ